MEDLSRGLGLHPMAVQKAIALLKDAGQVEVENKEGTFFYTAKL
jgi:DNA-binding transcriptional regulator YhcF (GntR family)